MRLLGIGMDAKTLNIKIGDLCLIKHESLPIEFLGIILKKSTTKYKIFDIEYQDASYWNAQEIVEIIQSL